MIRWSFTLGVCFPGVFAMPICMATETATSDLSPLLLNSAIAIGSLVLGWFLKVLADRMSQRKLFDHRLRLEKEYGLYADLWDQLFELRRAVGQLVSSLGSPGNVDHSAQVWEHFNCYQEAVRKGEPFMSESVYCPAREVVTLAWQIRGNAKEYQSINERRARGQSTEDDEALADGQFKLEEDNEAAFEKIDDLFKTIGKAIRRRVSP